MKPKHYFLTGLGTFVTVVGFKWAWDYFTMVKTSTTTVISTNGSGQKLVSVTGQGGVDAGKTVQGYELPTNVADVTFPLKVIVKPNQTLFGTINGGQTVQLNKRPGADGLLYWNGTLQQQENVTSYPEVQVSALKAVS
jgi:hypothetical protein